MINQITASFTSQNSSLHSSTGDRTPFAQINLHELERLNNIPSSAIRVYLSIASHAGPDGVCWPGRQRIGEQTALNREQVSKATLILSMAGLLEKQYRENGRVVYRLPLHQSGTGPVDRGPDAGPTIRFEPAPGSRWRQVAEPEPPGVRIDTPRCQTRHPEPTTEPTEERESAATEPAAPEPEPAPLSTPLPRIKTPPPEVLPESWIPIAADLRPDLPTEIIEQSAARFLDDRRAKGIELVDWLPSWRNWIRNERQGFKAPTVRKATGSPVKPADGEPSRYASWESGKPSPIGIQDTPEQARARFEANMRRYGAVLQPDGTWRKPGPVIIPPNATPPPLPRPLLTTPGIRDASRPGEGAPPIGHPEGPTAAAPEPLSLQAINIAMQEAERAGATRDEVMALGRRLNQERQAALTGRTTPRDA